MPKIPTFTAQARPTAEPTGVTTNLQLSPTATPAGALIKPISQIADYYAIEKQISNKVKAGELFGDATVDIFNAAEEAELKITPQEGIDYFNQQYNSIKNKYKSQAINSDVASYFDLEFSANKNKYVNNILSKTRTNLVTTRVNQVDQNVKSKIATAISGNKFVFKTLATSIEQDYQGLVNDGIISQETFNIYKSQLPALIETEMVKKGGVVNAFKQLSLLQDNKNYPNITGDAREDLRKELRSISEFQNKTVNFVTGAVLLKKKKEIAQALKGENNGYVGINPSELYNYSTGNKEYDNQTNDLNNKVINNKISLDNDYSINDKIINKILNNEIKHPFQKFKLVGEKDAKSITERIGNGSTNLQDDNFFDNIFAGQNDLELNKANKEFFQFIDKVVPMIEGASTAKFFDEKYNNRLSSFRQDMYKKFNEGLQNNIPITKLLDSLSEDYIGKDILDYAPKKSDLRNALLNYAKEKEYTPSENEPKKNEGESHLEWLTRWRVWKASN